MTRKDYDAIAEVLGESRKAYKGRYNAEPWGREEGLQAIHDVVDRIADVFHLDNPNVFDRYNFYQAVFKEA